MLAKSAGKRALLACASFSVVVGASSAAFAQQAENQPAVLGEIVVTAQKRTQNLQDVPATVTALSAQQLANRQINNVTDLQSVVPSMEVGQLFGANLITLRGISTGLTSGTEDPSVAVHVNGVYQPRSRSLDIALMDLDRAEVLSGPQGTLYGRNATGGVVNYITRGPTNTLGGELTGTVANYDRYAVHGGVSGPITDQAGFRLYGLYDSQGRGFTKNLLAGAPNPTLEDHRTVGGHAVLDYRPTDRLKFVLDGMYVNTKSTTLFAAFAPPNDPGLRAFLQPQTSAPHEVYSELPARMNSVYGQVSLTAAWKISENVDLKSISAYQNYIDHMDIDLDASPLKGVEVHQFDKSYTYSQEFDLTTHLFGDRLTSIYGVYYFYDSFKGGSVTDFGVIAPPALVQFHFPTRQLARSYAAFTDQTFKVTDKFRIIAGARYNRDIKSADQSGEIIGVAPLCPASSLKADWDAFTPKVGAQYDVTKNVMLYTQWQKGFKAGGFVANSCGNGYNPEHIKGPEIGIKSELFNHRLRLNAAAYHYDYTDLQVEKVVGVGTFLVQNAAAAVLKGVEVSAVAIVTPNLHADLAVNVQSAKYTSFVSCNQGAFVGACTAADPRPPQAQLVDLSGNWLNRAPPYSANLGVEYTLDLPGGGDLLMRAESYWSGKVHYDEFDSPQETQNAYNIQNIYLTYTPPSKKFEIRGFMKNVGNKDYKISGFFQSALQQFQGNWAPPRTFGMEATVKF